MQNNLPLELLRRIDAAASRFERAWNTSEKATIESVLAELPQEAHPAALRELLLIELELRRRAGETIDLQEYLRRFPSFQQVVARAAAESSGDHAATSLPGAESSLEPITQPMARDSEHAAIGPYILEHKLGEGGMGVVWVARQSQPVKRRVALKLIKPGMDSHEVVRRFEQERQALAVLDHPNIARVLDAGLTPDGRPYFAMEMVNGLPLTRFCDEARLSTRQRLEIFQQICYAVQHAHQKGIIHRDLKPANILITLIDGRPVPKVIDFGVAKALGGNLLEESHATHFGAVIGTLEYMAPEQAGYAGIDIDTRADIYALGVILYELLTGLRPFEASKFRRVAVEEMLRIVREDLPAAPSKQLSTSDSLPSLAAARQSDPQQLPRTLRGDLDWIAMKCLEKDRNRRYKTADQLADEVRRYLTDQPVEAGPPDRLYLLSKFIKRHRGQVLAGALLTASILLGLVLSLWQLRRAVQAEQLAESSKKVAVIRAEEATQAQREALRALAQAKVNQARGARRSQRIGGRTEALKSLEEARDLYRRLAREGIQIEEASWIELRSEVASAWLLSEVEKELLSPLDNRQPTTKGIVDFTQQRILEFPGDGSAFTLRDLKSGRRLGGGSGKIAEIEYAEFSEDGDWLFTAGAGPRIEIWNMRSDKPVLAWDLGGWLVAAASRTHPLVIATHDGKTSTVYDRATGAEIYTGLDGTPPWGNPFSPDGRRVVLYRAGEMFVLELESRKEGARWSPACDSIRWSTSGDQILATVEGRILQHRDSHTGALLYSADGFKGGLRGVMDGRQNFTFTHDWNSAASLRDARTGRLLFSVPFKGYTGVLQMSTRGERIDLLDRQGENHAALKLSRGSLSECAPGAHGVPVLSSSGRLMAAAIGNSIQIFDLATGRLLDQREHAPACEAIAFDGDDALWVSAGWRSPSQAQRWPILRSREHGLEQLKFGAVDRVCEAPRGAHWRALPDLSLFAVGGDGDSIYMMHPSKEVSKPLEPEVLKTTQSALRGVALSDDGRYVVAGGHVVGGVGVYERASKKLIKLLTDSGGWARFSPRGDFLAVAFLNDSGEVYRVRDWTRLYSIPGSSFAFSPDGQTLAVNEEGGGLRLLDSATGTTKLHLENAEGKPFLPAAFTADGEVLAATATDPPRVVTIDLGGLRRKLADFDSAPETFQAP